MIHNLVSNGRTISMLYDEPLLDGYQPKNIHELCNHVMGELSRMTYKLEEHSRLIKGHLAMRYDEWYEYHKITETIYSIIDNLKRDTKNYVNKMNCNNQ